MKCRVLAPEAALEDLAEGQPNLVLAFLPPRPDQDGALGRLRERFPDVEIAGCEAVTQFRGGELAREGCLQLFSWEHGEVTPWVELLADPEGIDDRTMERIAGQIAELDAVFLLADGLHFPVQELLRRLRRVAPGPLPRVAGGLASQAEPVTGPGARVFAGGRVHEGSAVLVGLPRIEAELLVVRGWDAASPVAEVTRAEGNVLFEIDGAPATLWFERFFRLPDGMAPMPESAYRFPLIIEGSHSARKGLYRSMRFYDDPPGAVTFWGDLETGDRVRLGIGNGASLARAAEGARSEGPVEAAVLYSCVGRQQVLGEEGALEIRAVRRALGDVPLAGFFTFGEIGPSAGDGPSFYNHTAILCLLREAPA